MERGGGGHPCMDLVHVLLIGNSNIFFGLLLKYALSEKIFH